MSKVHLSPTRVTIVLQCIVFFVGFILTNSSVANETCDMRTYRHAESTLPLASQNWRSLYIHQKSFLICDDGALAEGYSEAVVKLLAYSWQQVKVFSKLSEKNMKFKDWALNHIDSSTLPEDLHQIIANTDMCIKDKNLQNICIPIKVAAENALSQMQ